MNSHCRNCLFDSFSREQFRQNIEDYIKSLSPEEKADEKLYESRLEKCSECAGYLDGLCRKCGCFVMARAARKRAYCPDRRW